MTAAANIAAVVLGSTGYVGGELLRLLAAHPVFHLHAAVSRGHAGAPVGRVFPHLAAAYPEDAFVEPAQAFASLDSGARVAVFSAAPHGASAPLVAAALETAARRNLEVHVVDSSADFRYRDAAQYEKVYGTAHGAPRLLADFQCAVPEHGLPETSAHVGHPGCFATAVLLAAMPLADIGLAGRALFVSAITGSTGSGKSAQAGTHHPERHSNLYAYKPLAHRHVPEIERLLERGGGGVSVNLVPHSGPFARGIYATLQARLEEAAPAGTVVDAFRRHYADSEFVRVVDGPPKLKDVVASNYAHIGVAADGERVVVTCAIDNLVKGAAGGAVQWMNRLWSLPEATGLTAVAPAWT